MRQVTSMEKFSSWETPEIRIEGVGVQYLVHDHVYEQIPIMQFNLFPYLGLLKELLVFLRP